MTPQLVCALLAVSPSLVTAQKSFEAGKVDDVFLALENQKLAPAEKQPAAELLVRASQRALADKDGVMALSLAELALRQVAQHAGALEAASRAARSVEQFETAEAYADRWTRLDPKNTAARVVRAELALDAADWQGALNQLAGVKASGPLAQKVDSITRRAQSELNDRQSAVTPISGFETTMAEATAAARDQERRSAFAPNPAGEVIVYSTASCGYCRKAKAYLKKRGIDFTSKDIETDSDAAAELGRKAAAAGVRPQGVPVIDARGTLVLGFDPDRLDQLL